MSGRDAFGREIGEDPLADLGWGTSAGGAANPDASASPVDATTVTPAPARVNLPIEPPGTHLLRIGRWIRFLFTFGILAAVIFAGISAFNAGSDAVEDVRDSIGQVIPDEVAEAGAGDGPGRIEPGPSLLGRRQLSGALAALRRDAPGRVQILRIAADRVDVTVRTGGGRTRMAQFQSGAEAASLIATAPGGASPGTFRYADVAPASMERALQAARRATGKGAAKVDYLTFTGFGGRLGWGVYYGSGEIVQTDARGRFIRRIS